MFAKFIQKLRDHTDVMIVAKSFLTKEAGKGMLTKCIQKPQHHTDVIFVAKPFVSKDSCSSTWRTCMASDVSVVANVVTLPQWPDGPT